MSKFKKTSFNPTWLLDPAFSWCAEVPGDKFNFFCKLCKTVVSLSNMGKQALSSHMKGQKHQRANNAVNSSKSVGIFFKSVTAVSKVTTSKFDGQVADGQASNEQLHSSGNVKSSQTSLSHNSDLPSRSQSVSSRGVEQYFRKDSVTKSEILWCLNAIMQHSSLRSAANSVSLFKIMFPDSEIAAGMQLQKTKLAYTIVSGLAPYFQKEMLNNVVDCHHIVVAFDESLNKVAQMQQMDIYVRFWDKEREAVTTRYYNSAFLGHTTANDLLLSFKKSLEDINLKNVVQISMDGPNVNKKLLVDFKKQMTEDNQDAGILLDIGSCGLHTLHCAFKGGVKSASWKVVEFLRALHNLWHHVPARRADFISITGSSLFPLKFCSIRWLENAEVADRALKIFPSVQKYVAHVSVTKKVPTCNSFQIIAESVKDKALTVKLAFFKSVSLELEPFLREFQSDAPLAPFLYSSISSLVKNLMEKIVKPDVLKNSPCLTIDVTKKENLMSPKLVELGYETRIALSQAKLSEREILEFKNECRTFLQTMISKIMLRSPLHFKLTKAISCFDPLVATQAVVAQKRLSDALEIYCKNQWISGNLADKVHREYKDLCALECVQYKLASYRRNSMTLDKFWLELLAFGSFEHLTQFLKLVLILSHGNASLERGFSVNKECLVENMRNESLVAQRRIFDAVIAAGGLDKVEISKQMIHAARNSYACYKDTTEKKRKDREEEVNRKQEKRRQVVALAELEAQKQSILEHAAKEAALIDKKMLSLKN